jgi:hypothetical protein
VDLPAIFTSQGQAASMLGVDVYDVRAAKREGCRAFVGSGRIRAKELQAWLKNRQENRGDGVSQSTPKNDSDSDDEVFDDDWSHRDLVVLEVLEYFHAVYLTGQIDLAKYAKLGNATVELLLELNKLWDAGIDGRVERKLWRTCLREAKASVLASPK